MKPECAKRIQDTVGRTLTKAELEGIEQRVHASLRELASKDIDKFRSMSLQERMAEATKLAKERMISDTVAAHERAVVDAGRKAKLFADLDTVRPGEMGRVHYLKNKIAGIETRVNAISAEFFRRVDVADTGKWLGYFQDPAKVRDLNAAFFGESASAEAKAAAKTFQDANKAFTDFYRAEGLPLHELENWNLPQPQEIAKVAGAGRETWVSDMMQWIDPREYVNPDGGIKTPEQLREFLGRSYDTIATDGANKRADLDTVSGGHFVGANKNAPRQLFFKNSEAYTAAMEKYGRSTNPYELISSHIRGMANDLAFAEAFGRDAESTFRQALAKAKVADIKAGAKSSKIGSLETRSQRMFDALLHPDRAGNETWANIGVQMRGVMSSTQLGSLVGAFPDLAGVKMAAEFSGLPQIRTFRNVMDSIVAGPGGKDFLHRMGIWMEGFQHVSNRMAADEFKTGFGTWLNEATHKAMGLNAFDRGVRAGMGRTVLDTIGSFTRKAATLAEADGEARLLQGKGITEDHWQVWRAAELDRGRGNENLLTPDAIHAIPDEKLAPIVEKAVAQRSEVLRSEIQKRDTHNAREAEWLAGRIEKFKEKRQRAYDALEELREKRQDKVEQRSEAVSARAELLRAVVEKAQVEHDIALRLKTETAQDRIQGFLDAVEDGASAEAKGAGAGVVVSRYGGSVDRSGEALGRRRAQAEAKIAEAQKAVDALQREFDAKGDAKEKALARKFDAAASDIAEFAKTLQDRATRRREYAAAFEAQAGKVLSQEREKLRTEASVKLLELAYGEMQFGARGASRSSVEDRVVMGIESAKDAGTIAGELKRFALQFKSVPIGIFRAHWAKSATMDGWGSKWGYRARFVAYSTLMGALAVELKALMNGQDPRQMRFDTPEGRKFWLEALASGGGFGMYGDLFAHGRTGGGLGPESMAGPGIAAGWNLIKEVRTAIGEANEGETDHPYALSAVRWVRKNATPLMNLWYLKAAFNRLVFDQMQDMLAPGSSMKQQMRMEKRGVSYWWEPGTTKPQRAPEPGAAVADR